MARSLGGLEKGRPRRVPRPTLLTAGVYWDATRRNPREITGVFEGLNYEELRRRANERLSDRVVAKLEARGERRSVTEGEVLYRVDDRQYPFVHAMSATIEIRDPDGLVLGVMEPG